MRIGICPGSFDPVTLGHMDIISRACKIFDKVIVAVPVNPDKRASFTVEERMEMLRTVTADMENVEVDCVRGLLADYASEKHAAAIVKGLRAISDFEYEFQMALTNKKLNPGLKRCSCRPASSTCSSAPAWSSRLRASAAIFPILCPSAF